MNPLFLSKLYLKILSAEFYCGNEILPKVPYKGLKYLEGNPRNQKKGLYTTIRMEGTESN